MVWFSSSKCKEHGGDEQHLQLGTGSGENEHTAQNSDQESFNQHFLFHPRPERNTFGKGKERKGKGRRKEMREIQQDRERESGKYIERRKKMKALGRRQDREGGGNRDERGLILNL